MVTALNDETWSKICQENGIQFKPAKMVIFENGTQSGCGAVQSEMGPFYCPAYFLQIHSMIGCSYTSQIDFP